MPTRPLRVAVLDHTAELGGAELAIARLAAAIDPADVELVVLSFSPGPLVERIRQGGHVAEVVPLPGALAGLDRRSVGRLSTAFRSALRLVPFVWRLSRRVRELDVDVLHTTSLKADLIGVPVSILARLPLVWHVHDRIAPDYLPASMVWLLRLLARHVPAHVIANSAATAATLPRVDRLTVAHPGLAPDQLAASAPGPLAGQSPVIGVLGRISPTKITSKNAPSANSVSPGTRSQRRVCISGVLSQRDPSATPRDKARIAIAITDNASACASVMNEKLKAIDSGLNRYAPNPSVRLLASNPRSPRRDQKAAPPAADKTKVDSRSAPKLGA